MGALALVSAGLSALGTIGSAMSESRAAEYNAQVASQNAILARQQANVEAEQQRRAASKQIGAANAAMGASGISSGEGSALDLFEESAANAALDNLLIRHRGEVSATGFQNEARLEKSRAKNIMRSGLFSAGAKLVGGAMGQGGAGSSLFSG